MGKLDDVRARLGEGGDMVHERALPNGQVQLWIDRVGAVANVYTTTDNCTVQGTDDPKGELETLLGDLVGGGKRSKGRVRKSHEFGAVSTTNSVPQTSPSKKVFVVYGHDDNARNELEAILRRWGLDPLILDQLPSGGNTIIEKLEHYQDGVQWAVVLLTPDDCGSRADDTGNIQPRPRQNVVLELGMLLGKLGRKNVAILYRSVDPPMELPSDIQGYIYIPYKAKIAETRQTLAAEMEAAGFFSVPASKM